MIAYQVRAVDVRPGDVILVGPEFAFRPEGVQLVRVDPGRRMGWDADGQAYVFDSEEVWVGR